MRATETVKEADLKSQDSFALILARLDELEEKLSQLIAIQETVIPEEIVVSPSKPFTASIHLREILKRSQSYVKLVDPYVDDSTLDFLLNVPEGISIKLLTSQTGGKEKERRLRRACNKFKIERSQFEIRKCKPGLIHDRFILTQTQGWNVGSSLKDFGKKMSTITGISNQTKNEIERFFDTIWSKSTDLIAS